jgi:AbrB family looped-hinge helix DNA binding protein
MAERTFFKSRLRDKGQITVPSEIRIALGAEQGDDLLFTTDELGRVIVSRAQLIAPEQAWFWSERWQRLEHATQADIDAGRVKTFDTVEAALASLDQGVEPDAEG